MRPERPRRLVGRISGLSCGERVTERRGPGHSDERSAEAVREEREEQAMRGECMSEHGRRLVSLTLPVESQSIPKMYTIATNFFCQEKQFDSSVLHHTNSHETPQFSLKIIVLMASKLE